MSVPITQLNLGPGPGEQLGSALLQPLQLLAQSKLQNALLNQQRQDIAKQISPAIQNILKLENPEVANQYGVLGAYFPELIKQQIASNAQYNPQRVQGLGKGIQTIMPDAKISDSDAQILAVVGNQTPGVINDLYKQYNATPREFRSQLIGNTIKNIEASTQQETLQKVAPVKMNTPVNAGQQKAQEIIPQVEAQTKEQLPATKAAAAQKIATQKVITPDEVPQIQATEVETGGVESVNSRIARGVPPKDARKDYDRDRKEQHAKDVEDRKETKEYYDNTLDSTEAAIRNTARLQRMEKLMNEGKLADPTILQLLQDMSKFKIAGKEIDLPVFGAISNLVKGVYTRNLATDSEEFDKLSNDFVRDAKPIFGARMTDFDLSTFFKMIPTLMQSDKGKRSIIRNLKIMNELETAEGEVMKSIIKREKGRPWNLRILVQDELKPIQDKLIDEFVNNTQGSKQAVLEPNNTGPQKPGVMQDLLNGILGNNQVGPSWLP